MTRLRYVYVELIDSFGYKRREIARTNDARVDKLFLHPRQRRGGFRHLSRDVSSDARRGSSRDEILLGAISLPSIAEHTARD